MRTRPAALVVVSLLLAGCQGFRPRAREAPELGLEGKVRVSLAFVRPEQTVEARGVFRDGHLEATRIEIEEFDKEVMLKGVLERFDPRAGGAIGGVPFTLGPHSRFVDAAHEPIAADRVTAGGWAKVECVDRDGALRCRKLSLRRRKPGEEAQVQGRVDRADLRGRWFEIGGVRILFPPDIEVLWDVEGVPAPWGEEAQFGGVMERTATGLRRVQRVDEEERRPEKQLTLGGFLTVGGEVQYDLEWRQNHDLLTRKKRHRLIHEGSAKLELSADISPRFFAFTQLRLSRKFVHFDGVKDFEFSTNVDVEEAYLIGLDLPVRGLALQVGRQDFDHGREWVMDDQLDGVRLYVNLAPALLELSASTVLRDTTPEEDGVKNFLAGFHAEPLASQTVFLYALHRKGGTLVDLSRTHTGVTVEGEVGPVSYWLDAGLVRGREDHTQVRGHALDVASMYVFEDVWFEPSVYAGFAYGSGDDRPGRTDRNFRQTGLNDNNDRFNGVTSFRYLGELVRPELSNLVVYTAGAGLRPLKRTSLDLVYHQYRQVEASRLIRDSRLRLDPKGLVSDLGYGADAILGFETLRPVEVEAVLSYFHPGPAFGRSATDAWFGTLQVEYNF